MSTLHYCLCCNQPTIKPRSICYSVSYKNLKHPENDDFSEDCYDLCPKCFKKLMKGKISVKQLRKKRARELRMVDKVYDHQYRNVMGDCNNYTPFPAKIQEDTENFGDEI